MASARYNHLQLVYTCINAWGFRSIARFKHTSGRWTQIGLRRSEAFLLFRGYESVTLDKRTFVPLSTRDPLLSRVRAQAKESEKASMKQETGKRASIEHEAV